MCNMKEIKQFVGMIGTLRRVFVGIYIKSTTLSKGELDANEIVKILWNVKFVILLAGLERNFGFDFC